MTTHNARVTKKAKLQTPATPVNFLDARESAPYSPFPIVAIGASAGGLEAFEQFFRHIAPDSGMAFVLVSPLDPSHASTLTEILQRTHSHAGD